MLRNLRFAAVALACAAPCVTAAQAATVPASADRLFEFQSSLWVNLHHFLYASARARRGLDTSRTAIRLAMRDTAGYGKLSATMRRGWDDALAYYDREFAQKDILFDSALVAITDKLSAAGAAPSLARAGIDSTLRRILESAAPAYRANWWPRHDASNQRWIAALKPLLAAHGVAAAQFEARVFRAAWPDSPRVDVCAYTNWAGAYTTGGPAGAGRNRAAIHVSSIDPADLGTPAFESVFHEVLHTMDDSLFSVLRGAFRAAGTRFPRDPTHGFIFYTAGAVAKQAYPSYTPMAEAGGIWSRGDFPRMLPLLRAHWQSYLDGTITMEEALHRIAAGW